MDAKLLLSLDLSTTCTGWALFDLTKPTPAESLIGYGKIKPSTKGGVAKMAYPRQQLTKMMDVAVQVVTLIEQAKPDAIVIEEIAGSKNRLGQKTLDGLHYIVAYFAQKYLDIVKYYDVTGSAGWRTHLQLRLSDADKAANKEAKTLNKKLAASQRLPIIGPKHLAMRYVNSKFGMVLDVDKDETDADVGDAIAMGHSYWLFSLCKRSQVR